MPYSSRSTGEIYVLNCFNVLIIIVLTAFWSVLCDVFLGHKPLKCSVCAVQRGNKGLLCFNNFKEFVTSNIYDELNIVYLIIFNIKISNGFY